MKFGDRVRELRKESGMTQQQLADQLGVSCSYVNKVERDRLHFGDYPSEKFIHKLADELSANEDELLLLTDRVPKHIRRKIQNRPEVFDALARCDDRTLDWVLTAVRKRRNRK